MYEGLFNLVRGKDGSEMPVATLVCDREVLHGDRFAESSWIYNERLFSSRKRRTKMKQLKPIRDKTPIILSIISCAGVIATAVLAVKATPKAKLLIAQADMKKGEPLSKMEKAVAAVPAYIPAIAVGAGTIACIMSSSMISHHRQRSLASAYILLDNAFIHYKDAAKKVYGEDADEKISNQIALEGLKDYSISQDDLLDKEELPSEIPLFYDPISNRYFNRTFLDVQAAEYHLNRNLALRGDASINEFYSFLGLPPIDGGDGIGWGYNGWWEDGLAWIDFYHQKTVTDDGLECYVIYYMFDPQPIWE